MATILESVTIPRSSVIPRAALAPGRASSVSALSSGRNSVRLPENRGLKIQTRFVSRNSARGSLRQSIVRRRGGIVCEAQETAVEGKDILFLL